MFKTKDAILPALPFYSKGRGQIPWGVGVGCAKSSAVAQLAVFVFPSQKNKRFVRKVCPEPHIQTRAPGWPLTVNLGSEALADCNCPGSAPPPCGSHLFSASHD